MVFCKLGAAILLIFVSSALQSMEQSTKFTVSQFKNELISYLNNRSIGPIQFESQNILRLMFPAQQNSQNEYHCTFFVHHDRENKLYLNPIIPESESLEQMNRDYNLIDAIERGDRDKWHQFQSDANFSVLDARLNFISFNILPENDQKVCSTQDIVAGEKYILKLSKKPPVYCWPYANSYSFSIIEHLERNYDYHILKELVSDKKTYELNKMKQWLEINNFLKVVQADEKNLIFMQTMIRLLANEKNLDQFCICRLGKLYAKIIALQDEKGKHLISQIHDWKHYQILTGHMLHALSEMIRTQPYLEESLISTNFVELSKRIVQDEMLLKSVKIKEFFSNVLTYSKLYGVDINNKEWSQVYYQIVAMLLKNEDGKVFLKELCNHQNNENLFKSTIKPFMQNVLFRKFVVRQLICANPPLNEHVAPLVSDHWQPDETFINYFKKLPINKRANTEIVEIEAKKMKKINN